MRKAIAYVVFGIAILAAVGIAALLVRYKMERPDHQVVWPDTGPRVLWEVAIGQGYAGPVVHDSEVYLLDREKDARDILRCFDLQTGRELFSVACEAPGSAAYNGSRAPVTVGNGRIYGVGLMGDCYCFDIEKRALVWRRHLPTEFKIDLTTTNVSMWGMAQSPLLYRDLLIVGLQCADRSIAALNPETGDTVWTSERLGYQDYTMPVVATLGGVEQLVMSGGAETQAEQARPGKIAGISLDDGSTLWSVDDLWKCYMPVPPPLTLSDDRLLFTGGYKAGTAMLQVKKHGGAFKVKRLWYLEGCGSQIHQPVVYERYLYANTRDNNSDSGMVCISVDDGKLMWRTKGAEGAPNFERGPMLLINGMILNLGGMTGTLCLITPSPVGYREVARAKVLEGKMIWAHMAFSQGKLLVRNDRLMKCLDLRSP